MARNKKTRCASTIKCKQVVKHWTTTLVHLSEKENETRREKLEGLEV
jgi:hypothetical protein